MKPFPEVLPLRHASRAIVRELGFLQDHYTEAGISHSECHALLEIAEEGRTAQAELCEALRLDKSTTSRLVARLVDRGWVRGRRDPGDGRRNRLSVTAAGRRRIEMIHGPANSRVQAALATLTADERATVVAGIKLYAGALRATRLQHELVLRPIEPEDNAPLVEIIDACLAEFGGGGPGFANADPEFHALHRVYRRPRAAYFVVTREGEVLGGAGVAQLGGGARDVCEFQKMYLVPAARGHGLGSRLVDLCLSTAREMGYRLAYLETLASMKAARALYVRQGFERIERPMGATGHFGCDAWYTKAL